MALVLLTAFGRLGSQSNHLFEHPEELELGSRSDIAEILR
jgi:hypothetical protein